MKKEFIIQELESLIRSLDFIQEEQAFIKRKLSGLLENLVLNDFIIWAEDLQLQILNREAAVRLLKNDILILKKLQIVYLENDFITWKSIVNEKFEASLS